VGLLGSRARHDRFSSQYRSPPPPRSTEEEHISPDEPSGTFVVDSRVVDSGASHHLTGDRTLFRGFVRTCSVSVGGISGTLRATGVGVGTIRINGQDIHLSRVYFVPGMTTTLISASELVEAGHSITITKVGTVHGMHIHLPSGTQSLFLPVKEGLYECTTSSSPPPSQPPIFESEVGLSTVRGFASVAGKQIGNSHTGSLSLGELVHKRFAHISPASGGGHFHRELRDAYGPTVCMVVFYSVLGLV
jgi:hypothetical protein